MWSHRWIVGLIFALFYCFDVISISLPLISKTFVGWLINSCRQLVLLLWFEHAYLSEYVIISRGLCHVLYVSLFSVHLFIKLPASATAAQMVGGMMRVHSSIVHNVHMFIVCSYTLITSTLRFFANLYHFKIVSLYYLLSASVCGLRCPRQVYDVARSATHPWLSQSFLTHLCPV